MRIVSPNYFQTPNDLVDHWMPHLKEVELKVLLVIIRKTFGWHKKRDKISLSQMVKFTGSNKTRVCEAAAALQEKGIILKTVSGSPGLEATYYELVVDDSNNSDPCQDVTSPRTNTQPPPGTGPGHTKETIPKEKEINKGNDLGEGSGSNTKKGMDKGLPLSTEKGKRKYPLKKEQLPTLEWLRSQGLNCDDDTLIYFIRSYSKEQLARAIEFLKAEQAKNAQILNTGAFLRRVLDGSIKKRCANGEANRGLAVAFAELNEWTTLVITKKYCRDPVTSLDLYFDMDEAQFKEALNNMHDRYLNTR